MIRLLRILFLIVIAVFLVTVALANRELVVVKILPTEISSVLSLSTSAQVPLFLVIFTSILVGLLIGFVWEYLREFKIRREATRKDKQVVKLEKEVEVLRKKAGQGQDDVLALID